MFCIALAAAIVPPVRCQPLRPQTLTFVSSVDASEQPYALYLPRTLDSGKKYPVVISLHSEDSNQRNNLLQVLGASSRQTEGARVPLLPVRSAPETEFIVASPLARGALGYTGIAEADVYDVLADLERRFPVDEDRVYLTGVSMGGGGALRLALTRPDVWAAVAPVCPPPIPGVANLAGNALNLPVRLFHGEQDPVIPVASSRLWQRRLLDVGVAADYLEYPAVRHNSWDFAYRDDGVLGWFGQFRRDRYPQRVRFVTDSYRYASAYWVQIDALTPGVEGSIDAQQVGAGEVQVETHNLDGFTLSPDRPVTLVLIDGTLIRVNRGLLSFRKQAGRWVSGRVAPSRKRAGMEGPIAAAVSGRHIYVYGTAGDPSPAELAFRRATAETAARWAGPHPSPLLTFPVKADRDVTAEELDSDSLVLFGTHETNSLIARFADRLPLALSVGAADYGLLFVADLGKHYALVSSGLPWWTGFEDSGRPLDPFAPPRYGELESFGDYVIFKGSMAKVVAEGRFDREWKLPPDAAAKIEAMGTVTVK
ncbi:MAG TPA: alpha/beta hydrolase-fold protein [Bryobacteraceae bacterium]|nr:alpha/beta hydrolase-fold protein [Bryobacteraceae bacterium]